MKSIRKEFEGIYGNGGPLGEGKNMTTKNMLNRIPNREYQNNVSYETRVEPEPVESEGFPFGLAFFFILFIVVLVSYYFRDDIYNYFTSLIIKPKEVEPPKDLKTTVEKEEQEKTNLRPGKPSHEVNDVKRDRLERKSKNNKRF